MEGGREREEGKEGEKERKENRKEERKTEGGSWIASRPQPGSPRAARVPSGMQDTQTQIHVTV